MHRGRFAVGLTLAVVGLVAACAEEFKVGPPDDAGTGGVGGASGNAGTAGIGGSTMGSAGVGGDGGGGAGSGGMGCTAPKVICGDTCVDPTTDAANCGACGRSCLGTATCSKGACVPEAMTQNGEVAPYALADDGTYLYWVSPATKANVESRVRRILKAGPGGPGEAVFPDVDVRAQSLAFMGGKIYYGALNSNGVFSGVPDVDFPDSPAFATNQTDVRHIAVTASKVFWSAGAAAAIRGKAIAGTTIDPNITGQDNPAWVAADATDTPYWIAGTPRELRRTKADAPGYETFTTGNGLVAVELAGEDVYWADATAGVIRSAPKAATLPASGTDEFSGLGRVEGFRVEVPGGAGAGGASGAGGTSGAGGAAGSSGASGAGGAAGLGDVAATLYVVTTSGQKLQVWRKGPSDEVPFLLGEVGAKAAMYTKNPFGAAYVLTDEQYVYFADAGTVDASTVPVSQGDGVVYRVAK
jgi:stigma-specific protein Stig1